MLDEMKLDIEVQALVKAQNIKSSGNLPEVQVKNAVDGFVGSESLFLDTYKGRKITDFNEYAGIFKQVEHCYGVAAYAEITDINTATPAQLTLAKDYMDAFRCSAKEREQLVHNFTAILSTMMQDKGELSSKLQKENFILMNGGINSGNLSIDNALSWESVLFAFKKFGESGNVISFYDFFKCTILNTNTAKADVRNALKDERLTSELTEWDENKASMTQTTELDNMTWRQTETGILTDVLLKVTARTVEQGERDAMLFEQLIMFKIENTNIKRYNLLGKKKNGSEETKGKEGKGNIKLLTLDDVLKRIERFPPEHPSYPLQATITSVAQIAERRRICKDRLKKILRGEVPQHLPKTVPYKDFPELKVLDGYEVRFMSYESLCREFEIMYENETRFDILSHEDILKKARNLYTKHNRYMNSNISKCKDVWEALKADDIAHGRIKSLVEKLSSGDWRLKQPYENVLMDAIYKFVGIEKNQTSSHAKFCMLDNAKRLRKDGTLGRVNDDSYFYFKDRLWAIDSCYKFTKVIMDNPPVNKAVDLKPNSEYLKSLWGKLAEAIVGMDKEPLLNQIHVDCLQYEGADFSR